MEGEDKRIGVTTSSNKDNQKKKERVRAQRGSGEKEGRQMVSSPPV